MDDLYAQQRSCARKRQFPDKAKAKQVAKKYVQVKPYLCRFCGMYHLGHRHGAEWEL